MLLHVSVISSVFFILIMQCLTAAAAPATRVTSAAFSVSKSSLKSTAFLRIPVCMFTNDGRKNSPGPSDELRFPLQPNPLLLSRLGRPSSSSFSSSAFFPSSIGEGLMNLPGANGRVSRLQYMIKRHASSNSGNGQPPPPRKSDDLKEETKEKVTNIHSFS